MESEEQRNRGGMVWRTLQQIAAELFRIRIPFATAGALALQHHGAVGRSTEDVDLVVSSESDLRVIHTRLVGHGYLLKSPSSGHLRDEVTRVRIEFRFAGEYPGDGKPKPARFPNPADVAELSADGLPFVNLRAMIEMKLASAKSAAHRIKDRADVLDLIHIHHLAAEYAGQLDPYVQEEFRELAALPPASEGD